MDKPAHVWYDYWYTRGYSLLGESLRGCAPPERSLHPLRKLHPFCKILHPMEKSKYVQFDSKIKQFSPKTALFSYQTSGLFQDDWLMSSPDATPLEILHPPEILPWIRPYIATKFKALVWNCMFLGIRCWGWRAQYNCMFFRFWKCDNLGYN